MWTAFVIGALVAPSIVASPPFDRRPLQRFTLIESGGGLGIDVENTKPFLALGHGATATWFVERNGNESNWCGRVDNGKCIPTRVTSMDWIDGRTCAPLRGVLLQLEKVRTNERGSAHPWASDTPLLSLIMFERHGLLASERLSEYVGPLVDWWRSAQEQLKPCWTKTRPRDL
jgi:hypothetical protein